ncbi:MAG TPA: ABC transporter permease [Vicinamibacterales bacterium]|nr:ABC transporter permease [Vicinamibacterales bacterium]
MSAQKSGAASPNTIRLGAAVVIVGLLALWAIAIKLQTSSLLPGPVAVGAGIVELAEKGLLLKYVVASLFRVTWGFLLAALLAIPAGLAIGLSRRAEMAFNPIIQMLRPISPLAWIPIAILWFGVGDIAAIFLIFLASFLPLVVTAINSVASIPDVYLNAGRNFGLNGRQIIFRVLYPAVTPQLILGLRITLGIAWLVVVAAEMIAVNSGLGFLIIDSRNSGNRYDLVIAGMVLIGLVGLLLDVGVRSLEKLPSIAWGYSDD